VFSLLVGGLLATGAAQTITVAVTSDPQTLDPHISATAGTVTAVNHIFDKLVQRDPATMAIVSDLAESWEIVDNVTYTFHLRQGVSFHNGEEFNADDVLFSFARMRQPGFEQLGKYVEPLIESVEKIDDYTVQFNLVAPYGPFLNRMPSFYMVPQDYITEVGDEEFARNPVGTGPFTFLEWIPGERLVFQANPDYWAGAPEAQTVVFRPIPEASTRIAALLSGDVDIIEQVNLTDIPRLERGDGARVEVVNDNGFYFYGIQSSRPPFDDVRVRQALTYAVNWDEVLSIFDGYAFRVPLPALPTDFGYSDYIDDIQHLLPTYDPERARELLAEAGYPNGFDTIIEASNGNYPKDAELAQAVAAQLAEIGINAEVRVYEWGVYLADVWRNGNADGLAFFSMGNPLFDPDHLYTVHFDPNGSGSYYNHPELTELGELGRVTTDPKERADVYRRMMEHLLTNVPYLWTHGVQQVYAVRPDINWKPRADNRIFMDEVTFNE
jgi:peptide/nickel transport system substrate-binding protein